VDFFTTAALERGSGDSGKGQAFSLLLVIGKAETESRSYVASLLKTESNGAILPSEGINWYKTKRENPYRLLMNFNIKKLTDRVVFLGYKSNCTQISTTRFLCSLEITAPNCIIKGPTGEVRELIF
tara:strand:+ start:336 stop:713 length:378 start_codon:yes stop_codon:yes gene_type:complete